MSDIELHYKMMQYVVPLKQCLLTINDYWLNKKMNQKHAIAKHKACQRMIELFYHVECLIYQNPCAYIGWDVLRRFSLITYLYKHQLVTSSDTKLATANFLVAVYWANLRKLCALESPEIDYRESPFLTSLEVETYYPELTS
jgi:hypothetical protein